MAQLQRVAIAPSQIQDQTIQLTEEQQHYLSRVLRLRFGDRFIALNGQGQAWLTELVPGQTPELLAGKILESVLNSTELPIPVKLVVALPKGSGFEEIVRQATELGVSEFFPVISDRTVLQPSSQKVERWRRIANEAAEQSERQRVPVIHDPVDFATHLQHLAPESAGLIQFFCITRQDSSHLLDCLSDTPTLATASGIVVATGPEGGWTPAEAELAIASGYQPVSLGSRILRAVTAPIMAISLISACLDIFYD